MSTETNPDANLIPLALHFVKGNRIPLQDANHNMRYAMRQARLKGATLEQIAEAAETSPEAVAERLGEVWPAVPVVPEVGR